MREIKFRVWDTENDMGGIMIPHEYTVSSGYLTDIFNGADITVMQYTGLKDKNGVEIYDGDLVMWDTTEADHKPVNEVNWKNDLALWCFGGMPIHRVFESGYYQPSDGRKPFPGEGFEIVGNIHEGRK
tara:strand:+ start:279 stop:662 length:384 start_codon:yes stop_codon:yes gene_type:complete